MDKIRLARRLAELVNEMPSLLKETWNEDAKFNYPSIDEYYKKIASLAAGQGLYWRLTETNCQIIGDNVATTYSAAVFDTINFTSDEDFCRFSVVHPIQGAQTAGSSFSYADKIFMRTVFKIVTGEPDADAFAKPNEKYANKADSSASKKSTPPPTQKPVAKPSHITQGEADKVVAETKEVVIKFPASKMNDDQLKVLMDEINEDIWNCQSGDDLKVVMMKRADDLAVIKERMPNENGILIAEYKKRRDEVRQEEKETA